MCETSPHCFGPFLGATHSLRFGEVLGQMLPRQAEKGRLEAVFSLRGFWLPLRGQQG